MKRVKYLMTILISVIIIFTSLLSCEKKNTDVQVVPGLFYKIEKDGSYIYIGGSIHYGKQIRFIDAVENAYKESECVGVEINIQDSALATQVNKEATYDEGDDLYSHISEETKDKLEKILKEFNLDIKDYKQNKLWVITGSIIAMETAVKAGFNAGLGIENIFIGKAKADKKPIISLENVDIQIKAATAGGDDYQLELLNNYKGLDKGIVETEELYNAVINGDKEYIEKVNSPENFTSDKAKEWYDFAILDRNKSMVTKIEKLLSENKKYFIVVGAAHLVGENGIIKALEDRGYTVTKLE